MQKLLLVGWVYLVLTGCQDQPGAIANAEEGAGIAHNRSAQSTSNPAEICLSNYGHTLPCNAHLKPNPEGKQQRWVLIRNEILPVED